MVLFVASLASWTHTSTSQAAVYAGLGGGAGQLTRDGLDESALGTHRHFLVGMQFAATERVGLGARASLLIWFDGPGTGMMDGSAMFPLPTPPSLRMQLGGFAGVVYGDGGTTIGSRSVLSHETSPRPGIAYGVRLDIELRSWLPGWFVELSLWQYNARYSTRSRSLEGIVPQVDSSARFNHLRSLGGLTLGYRFE